MSVVAAVGAAGAASSGVSTSSVAAPWARSATGETRAVGLARVGCVDQLVVIGTLSELRRVDFGGPLHSMVLLGQVGADEA